MQGSVMPHQPDADRQAQRGADPGTARVRHRDGGLGVARDQYDNPMVTDVGTTTFTIDAGGLKKAVNIYALGFETEGVPDIARPARVQRPGDAARRLRPGRLDRDRRLRADRLPRHPDGRAPAWSIPA